MRRKPPDRWGCASLAPTGSGAAPLLPRNCRTSCRGPGARHQPARPRLTLVARRVRWRCRLKCAPALGARAACRRLLTPDAVRRTMAGLACAADSLACLRRPGADEAFLGPRVVGALMRPNAPALGSAHRSDLILTLETLSPTRRRVNVPQMTAFCPRSQTVAHVSDRVLTTSRESQSKLVRTRKIPSTSGRMS